MNHTTDQAALQRALDAALAEREREMEHLLKLAGEGATLSRRWEAVLVVLMVLILAGVVVWGVLR